MAIDHPHWLLWLPHPQLPEDEKPYEKRWFALPAVSLSVFFIALDISIIGIIAPAIIKELGATSSQIQWSFDAYTVTLASFVVLGGALADRFGQQVMAVFSLIMMGAGMLVLAALQLWGGLFNVIVGLVVYGVGFGLIVSAATSAVMIAIPKEKVGDGSAVNLVSRQLGGAIGVAVLGSLASAIYRSKLDLASFDVTAQQQHKISDSLAGVVAIQHELEPKMAEQIDAMADAAMVDGLVWAMALGAIICAVSAALSAYLLRKREKPDFQPAT